VPVMKKGLTEHLTAGEAHSRHPREALSRKKTVYSERL
jgi:hypothetical protein